MRNASKPVSPEEIAAEISRLSRLPLRELRAAWQAEFRRAPPKGLWRDLLLRTLAWRIQEKAFGGHDKATLKLLAANRQKRGGDQRCQRLKTGTVLVRDFGGVRHTVTILPEGFNPVWLAFREETIRRNHLPAAKLASKLVENSCVGVICKVASALTNLTSIEAAR